MRTLLAIAVASLLFGCSSNDAGRRNEIRGLDQSSAPNRQPTQGDAQILAAVKALPDLAKFDFKFLELDVHGDFALATLEATGQNLDPLTVLLNREDGKWRVLDYGTVIGDPREFGVPDETARRWDF